MWASIYKHPFINTQVREAENTHTHTSSTCLNWTYLEVTASFSGIYTKHPMFFLPSSSSTRPEPGWDHSAETSVMEGTLGGGWHTPSRFKGADEWREGKWKTEGSWRESQHLQRLLKAMGCLDLWVFSEAPFLIRVISLLISNKTRDTPRWLGACRVIRRWPWGPHFRIWNQDFPSLGISD